MDPEKIQAVVSRHLQAIRDDLKELEDSPENREKIQNAIRTALGDEGKAVGLGSILGECWAAFMPKLLFMARSPETELELLTAAQRLIKEQCMEFSRILSGQARQQPPNQNG